LGLDRDEAAVGKKQHGQQGCESFHRAFVWNMDIAKKRRFIEEWGTLIKP
jgi:hypothetical protein